MVRLRDVDGAAKAERHFHWSHDTWAGLRPSAHGVYVNELGSEGEDRVRDAYTPQTSTRLVALKNPYDPTNLIRLIQKFKPTV